jgi:hypothetical protein
VGSGIVGVECKGPHEFGLTARKVPIVHHLVAAENGVRMSQAGIRAKNLAGCGAKLAQRVPESGEGGSLACFGRSTFFFISA